MCVTLELCLHAVPEVEGSSAFLRLSLPNVERLAVILDRSGKELEGPEELEGALLDLLRTNICFFLTSKLYCTYASGISDIADCFD